MDSTFPGALGLNAEGLPLVAGVFRSEDGRRRPGFAGMGDDGMPAGLFPRYVGGPQPFIRALRSQVNGRILVGGSFEEIDGQSRSFLARVNSDGSPDTEFLSGLAGPDRGAELIQIQPDNKILIAGDFLQVNGVAAPGFVRLWADAYSPHLRLLSGVPGELQFDWRAERGQRFQVECSEQLERSSWMNWGEEILAETDRVVFRRLIEGGRQKFYRVRKIE